MTSRILLLVLAHWCLMAALAGAAGAAPATATGARASTMYERGERIYRLGILPSGKPLRGMMANGAVREGLDAACTSCHRRSGFGIAEGPFVVRPITGPELFQTRAPVAATQRIAHQLGRPARPPYDSGSIGKAIREGIDVNGRAMSELMPRYALDASDMRSLASYLRSLSANRADGVDEAEIHLATVIQPGVSVARRSALLAVLQTFVHDKNAAVRSEPARRRAGAMRMYRAYRTWVLHVWQLHGAESSWPAQLEEHYRRHPVFALVSGIGDQSWAPIHAFSETRQLPCILPIASLPELSLPNFYTVYFSRGVTHEAQGVAHFLGSASTLRKIVQLFRADDPAGLAAASAFRTALPLAAARLTDVVLPDGSAQAALNAAAADGGAAVLWLGRDDLAGLDMPAQGAGGIFLSNMLQADKSAERWHSAVQVSRWDHGARHQLRVKRATDWMAARGITAADEEAQVNALFAITLVGEVLAHMMDSFSREYFVEQVEHNVTTTTVPSMYPRLSLGPDQRFAASEVYIGQIATPVSGSGAGASLDAP